MVRFPALATLTRTLFGDLIAQPALAPDRR